MYDVNKILPAKSLDLRTKTLYGLHFFWRSTIRTIDSVTKTNKSGLGWL